jgi:hypothetical protein
MEKWGDKPCDHKHLEKEYYHGSATGDYVCKQCGRAGYGENWPAKEKMEANMEKKPREVEVVKHGSDGYKPKDINLCPYKGESFCESGSGSSICGDHNGTKIVGNKEYVLCGFNKDDKV